MQSCQVIIEYNSNQGSDCPNPVGSGANQMSLTLEGTVPQPSYMMSVSPMTSPPTTAPGPYDFGSVNVGGASGPQVFTVTNTGNQPLTMMAANSDSITFQSSPPMTGNFPIAVNGNQQFTVTCHPQAPAATHNATFTFTTGSTEGMLTVDAYAQCEGVATSVGWVPLAYDFNNVLLPASPQMKTVTLSTTGTATVSSFAISPATGVMASEVYFNPTPPTNFTLTAANSLPLTVEFAPTVEHTAGSLGQVKFSDGAGNTLSIPINGGAFTGSISSNPASIDFGPVCAGSSPAPQTIEVYANESGDVTVKSDSTFPAAPFSAGPVSPQSLPFVVHGFHNGQSLNLKASLNPTTASDNDYVDNIVLDTDIPSTPPTHTIQLKAHVLPAGISPTPDMLHLGDAPVHMPSGVKSVKLTNCGMSSLMVTGTTITGMTPRDFTATPLEGSLPITLQSTEAMTFLVQMVPSSVGPEVATLDIMHSAGMTSVPLDGIGDSAASKDRLTYYACSTGSASGLAPVAIVLGFALRRRRR
jgi:MYXO-CTERM domain-containing protein